LTDDYRNRVDDVEIEDTVRISEFLDSVFGNKRSNSAERQYLLGMAYLKGVLTERNPEFALKYLNEAYLKGYAKAFTELANMYRYGNSVPRDKDLALEYSNSLFSLYEDSFKRTKELATAKNFLNTALEFCSISEEFGDFDRGTLIVMHALLYEVDFIRWFGDSIAFELGTVNSKAAKIKRHNADFDSAISYINTALKYFDKSDSVLNIRETITALSDKASVLLNEGRVQEGLKTLYSVVLSLGNIHEKVHNINSARDCTIAVHRLCYTVLKLDEDELKDLPFDPNNLFESAVSQSKDIYEKTLEKDDLSNLARAYNFNGEWLYRKNLFEDAVNNFSCAFKIVTRGNVENALYNDLLFASKVARNIGDSFVELKVYMAAYNAYSKGYSLLSDMYERNIGDKVHLLTYLSELSELLGDTAVFLRSNNRAENIMDPFDLFKNAIDVEVSLYDLTGDKKHYMERRDKLIKKMV